MEFWVTVMGHKENHCFKKKNNDRKKGDWKFSNEANVASSEKSPRAVTFMAGNQNLNISESKKMVVNVIFCADSGCTRFMINDCRYFSSKQQRKEKSPITFADRSWTYVTFIGTVLMFYSFQSYEETYLAFVVLLSPIMQSFLRNFW